MWLYLRGGISSERQKMYISSYKVATFFGSGKIIRLYLLCCVFRLFFNNIDNCFGLTMPAAFKPFLLQLTCIVVSLPESVSFTLTVLHAFLQTPKIQSCICI